MPLKQEQLAPEDIFLRGYLAVRAAEDSEKSADFHKAREQLEQANQMFGSIRKLHPEWKPEMVNSRMGTTVEALKRLSEAETEAAMNKGRSVVAERQGDAHVGAVPVPMKRTSESAVPTPRAQMGMRGVDMPSSKRPSEGDAKQGRPDKQVASSESTTPTAPVIYVPPPTAPSDHAAWTAYSGVMECLTQTGGGGYTYVLQKAGGTSVYLKVVYDDTTIGAILPENSATSIEGEFTSWNVARLLGLPEISQPAARLTLKGHALNTFRDQLASSSFSGNKEKNRTAVLKRIGANPTGIPTVFKQWLPMRPVGLESLVSKGRLNKGSRLAGFLRNAGPMPGKEAMSFKEIRDAEAPELELARQMSNILLVDALVGQWDRFSGGNIHAYAVDGRLQLVSLDNGGATVTSGNGYMIQFEESVTRFDRRSVENLLAMQAFLQGDSAGFAGYEDPVAFTEALGFYKRNHERFVARVKRVADHVKASVKHEGGLFP